MAWTALDTANLRDQGPTSHVRRLLAKFFTNSYFCPVTNSDPGDHKDPGPMRYAGLGVQLAVSLLVFVLAASGSIAGWVPGGIVTVAAAFLGFGGTMYWLIRQLNRKDGGAVSLRLPLPPGVAAAWVPARWRRGRRRRHGPGRSALGRLRRRGAAGTARWWITLRAIGTERFMLVWGLGMLVRLGAVGVAALILVPVLGPERAARCWWRWWGCWAPFWWSRGSWRCGNTAEDER